MRSLAIVQTSPDPAAYVLGLFGGVCLLVENSGIQERLLCSKVAHKDLAGLEVRFQGKDSNPWVGDFLSCVIKNYWLSSD